MITARIAIAAAIATAAPAAQAATVVFDTTSPTVTTAASQTVTSGGVTATFTGGFYAGTVAAMNAAGGNVALTAGSVRRAATGLGVSVAGDGQGNQVDSTGTNELLQVVFSNPGRYRIVSATVGVIDSNDTFALFGSNGGAYTRLGFTGAIAGGISGGIGITATRIANETYRLDFGNSGGFTSFRFGTNLEDGDGFSLRSLSVAAVPEPSTWAMLILGFGLVGGALRRKVRAQTRVKATLAFA